MGYLSRNCYLCILPYLLLISLPQPLALPSAMPVIFLSLLPWLGSGLELGSGPKCGCVPCSIADVHYCLSRQQCRTSCKLLPRFPMPVATDQDSIPSCRHRTTELRFLSMSVPSSIMHKRSDWSLAREHIVDHAHDGVSQP